jgi:hypothetical protein
MSDVAARRMLFMHQDGLAILTAVALLDATGTLQAVDDTSTADYEELGCSGAIAASLRVLVNAGWLEPNGGGRAKGRLTERGRTQLALRKYYLQAHSTLRDALQSATAGNDSSVLGAVGDVAAIVARSAIQAQSACQDSEEGALVATFISGALASVALPRLRHPADPDRPSDAGMAVLRALGWAGADGRITDTGRTMDRYMPNYGLIGSYAEALLALPEEARLRLVPPSWVNRRTDRIVNVVGSAASHRGYFRASEQVFERLFDDAPLAQQPQAIVDVGCGDGSWLRAIHAFVRRSTRRGRHLQEAPLKLIGVDADPVALECAARSMDGLDAHLLLADVGDPEGLMQEVAARTGIDPRTCLHIRAFVDHNRASHLPGGPGRVPDLARPVYVTGGGTAAVVSDVEQDWCEHLRKWGKVLGSSGLLMIEAHPYDAGCQPSSPGVNLLLAFEYFHALSGQIPVSASALSDAVTANGLNERLVASVPGNMAAVTVRHVWPGRAAGPN